jgi:hypothetical protein
MYLITVIDMFNIGFNAREPRWDPMGAHVAGRRSRWPCFRIL